MMLARLLFVGCGLSLMDGAWGQAPGSAECDANLATEPCRIAWNLEGTPRAYHWLQKLDADSGTWRNVDTGVTDNASRSIRPAPVAAGHLYRVQACNDAKQEAECVASTVVWAPLSIAEAKDVPEWVNVTEPNGKQHVFHVSKGNNRLVQAVQYNVYLMMKSIVNTRAADLPEMTKPRDVEAALRDGTLTDIDQIQHNVYAMYIGQRGIEPKTEEQPASIFEYHLPTPDDRN
jgi:hypothetical protein